MTLLAGRYRVLSSLGSGGMGEVVLAEDSQLHRRVAIKFPHSSHDQDALARERFRREALAAAAIDHPFICKIHEIGEADGRTFIVMEYVEGETLQSLASRGLLPLRQVAELANEVAQALEEAHRRGIVHRDLKPANVMVTKQGHLKVMDFGLARQMFAAAGAGADGKTQTVLTDSGTRLGTPAYMSPEQVVGGGTDARSDIFSLGVILHELTTGSHPFLRDDIAATMTAIVREPPTPGPRDADSLQGFAPVTARMLAKDTGGRYQTMSELRVELEALRDRLVAGGSVPGASSSAGVSERTPFVARDSEAAELMRLLDRMLAGQGGLALIGGEPGVGKTRLSRELLRRAAERGCLCLTGHCSEMEGAAPFAPLIESTEQAVRLMPRVVRTAMGDLAGDLSLVVPSLRRAFPDIPPAPVVPPEQQRRLVFSAFLDYARRLTADTPIVVLLDDLHWADEPSLQLLSFVVPHLESMRLLVVGTYRDVELDVTRPFAKTLETLLRQRLATRVTLRRLSESGVQQMLTAMHGSAAPSALAKVVFRETEGNPFFVEEVYQHLSEEGKLFDEQGRWREGLRAEAIDVPEGVRLVIGRRLERVGEVARKVLTAAAVIGRAFALDLLQLVVDVPEDDVLDALEAAERAQLIATQPGVREARYEFVHELIRTTLSAGLSLPRRQRLHLKIADALERLRASFENQIPVLAHHLYQAGAAADVERTSRYMGISARKAVASGAFEEALDLLDRIEILHEHPLPGDLCEARGGALLGLHKADEALAPLETAFAQYSEQRNAQGLRRVAQAVSSIVLTRSGSFAHSVDAFERALNSLPADAVNERVMVGAQLAVTLQAAGRFEDAESRLSDAAAAADQITDPHALGILRLGQAHLRGIEGQVGRNLEVVPQILTLIDPSALWDRATAAMTATMTYLTAGRLSDADAARREFEFAARAGNPAQQFLLPWFQSVIAIMRTGDIDEFISWTGLVPTPFRFHGDSRRAVGLWYRGQKAEALDIMQRLVGQPAVFHEGILEANVFVANALLRGQAALPLFIAAEAKLPQSGRRNLWGGWQALEAVIPGLALAGDQERLGALYPRALEWLEREAVVADLMLTVGPGSSQLAAALAAQASGLVDKATQHFEIAARQAREMPHRLLQPAVTYWHGRTLLDAEHPSDVARGRAMIEAAAADFESLKMPVYVELAKRTLIG